MSSTTPPQIQWLSQVEEHDYPAAASYLRLHYPPRQADAFVAELRGSPLVTFKAKDLFRASGLSLLGVSNSHVLRDQKKIATGRPLSPLLLVRHEGTARVIIADGYHRLCAVYRTDEDAVIPCQIV